MRILVTGSRGQLGLACLDACRVAGLAAVGVDLPDGDLTDPQTAPRLLAEHRPDRVIHTAGYTAVDRAESERDQALAVNTTATELLARACAEQGSALTYVSTDYVFPGDDPAGYAEDAPLGPVNWYGETKARGEAAVQAQAGTGQAFRPLSWQIVRTSWLFGHGPANFVLAIRRRLREGASLRVVADQRGCPTYAPDLADLLLELAVAGAAGIFHGTNAGVCTWYEFAREIARLDGHPPARITPCTTDEYPTAARRPASSILCDTRLEPLGTTPRPTWQDALSRYLTWLAVGEAPEDA